MDPSSGNPGKVAWIVGASSGIGRALAMRLAAEGWQVATSARRADALEALSRHANGAITAFVLDMEDRAAVRQVCTEIEERMGPIALAVLAAGTYVRDTPSRFDADALRRVVELNLMGTASCLEAIIPPMIARRAGRIALVGSVSGYAGLPGGGIYGATKSALITLAQSMQPDLARHGVGVSIVNPGFVATPLTAVNDFPMPFMISAEDAAARIVRGLDAGKFEIAFPRRMVLALKLLSLLPYPLFFALTRRMLRKD